MQPADQSDRRFPGARVLWALVHVGLPASGVWIWHTVLLKRHLDSIWPMSIALAAVFLMLLLGRWLAARHPGVRPGWLRRAWARIGRQEMAYLALFLVLLLVLHFGFERARSDGRAYFIQVRSLVMEGNFEFEAEEASFGFAGDANDFAFGAPLLWVPFFVAAHLWLNLLNLLGSSYPVEGFFNPYQRAVAIGSLVYGTIALVLIDRMVRRYYPPGLATLANISVIVGGFAAWYLTIDATYSHAVSLLGVTAFLYYWDGTRQEHTGHPRTTSQWALLGLLAGFMAMARWQNALFAVVPAVEALRDYGRILGRGDRKAGGDLLIKHLVFSACILVAFSPQSLVWELSRGSWFDLPDQDHAIYWLDPDPSRELFSPDRGLFAWTPLLVFAALGFFLLLRRRPWLGGLLGLAFLCQLYISSTIVSVGHGHAARKFTSSTVVFVFGLAALLHWLRKRPLVAPVAVIAAFVGMNVFFMIDLRTTALEQESAVPYTRIVESTTSRLGNPFTLPWNLWFAWQYETETSHWERIGTQTYNNVPIDVGDPTDEKFLGIGWGGRERGQGMTFRWATAKRATVIATLKARDRYVIAFRAAAFLYPGAEPQRVRVVVNGTPVGDEAVGALDRYRVVAPPDTIRRGVNVVRFEFSHVTAPAEVGVSEDVRTLAVLFDRIELLRRPR